MVESSVWATRCPVVAIIVSYNPDAARLRRVVQALEGAPCRVVLVDNASAADPAALFDANDRGKIIVHRMGINAGIGKALNAGVEIARSLHATHVLLMDQDSVPRPGMVSRLLAWDAELRARGVALSAIGPRFADAVSGQLSRHVRFARWHVGRIDCGTSNEPVPVDYLITSGSLIALDTLERVGPMDESLFIDHVDTEWILRARSLGLQAYGACDAVMEHELGEFRRRVWLLRWRDVPFHKPFRYYYIVRNSLALYQRAYMPREWVRVDAVRLLQIFVYMSLFHPQRWQFLRMAIRGVRDALAGRSGAL
jgi:rhamnosyltransferase